MIDMANPLLANHEEHKRLNAQGLRLWATSDDREVMMIDMGLFTGLGRALDHWRELDDNELWPESYNVHAVRVADDKVFFLDENEDWVMEGDKTWEPMPERASSLPDLSPKKKEQTLEYRQLVEIFCLKDIPVEDANVRFGWYGDDGLHHVAHAVIAPNRELVIYQVDPVPGETQIHFEVYATTEDPILVPVGNQYGVETEMETACVMMSPPDIHGWG